MRWRYAAVVEERWNHTAVLQATIISVNSSKPVSAIDLHPTRKKTKSNPQRDSNELDRFMSHHQRKINDKKR